MRAPEVLIVAATVAVLLVVTVSGSEHMLHEHEDDPGPVLGSPFHPGLPAHLIDPHVLPQGHCEPIKIRLCMDVGYNQTTMPNLVGHDAQADADALLQTFTPLIQYGCSPHLKLFLCSAHAPMCTDKVPQPIGPCRSLCDSVRSKCEPVMTEFGFKWPPPLDCSKFYPQNNHQHMCIPGPMDHHRFESELAQQFPVQPLEPGPKPSFPAQGQPTHNNVEPGPDFPLSPYFPSTKTGPGEPEGGTGCQGPRKLWTKGTCWTKCHGPGTTPDDDLFTEPEKSFARNYALPWAVLSLSTALIAFLLSFRSPRLSRAERPIIYIALCQVMYSSGIILGSSMSAACFTDKGSGAELLAGKGSVPAPCAVIFLLTYFFGTAANAWWAILCLSWSLSLNSRLGLSLEQKEWSSFHLVCWGFASVLTSAALLHKKVDADELTGLCGVGYQDMDALTYYHLLPLNVVLSLGLLFLLASLSYRLLPTWNFRFGRRKVNKSGGGGGSANQAYSPVLVLPPPPSHCPCPSSNGGNGNSFQRLRALENSKAVWIRIGIFSLVHTVPLAAQVGTIVYELAGREDWEAGIGRPNLQIFLFRLNMNLIAGLTTGLWVLSTFSWKSVPSFLAAVLGTRSPEVKLSPEGGSGPSAGPLLVPAPVSAYSEVTSAHSMARSPPSCPNARPPNFAGILPRYHNHPLPPLPARNPDQRTDAWRRGETIV